MEQLPKCKKLVMATAEAEMDLDFPTVDLRKEIVGTCKSPGSTSDVSGESRAGWEIERVQNAVIELSGFLSSGKLTATESSVLLDILKASEELGRVSCMEECCRMLANLPMMLESALFYLDYSCSKSMAAAFKPLKDAAKKFLCTEYSDFTKFEAEAANIHLAGIQAILSSNDLEVESEDQIFNFVLTWAHSQYPKVEERREILNSHLLPLVRFDHMTSDKLLEIKDKEGICNCIDHEQLINFIAVAVILKDVRLYQITGIEAEESGKSAQRAYLHRIMDVVRPDLQRARCVASLDLGSRDFARLLKSGYLRSQWFEAGRACFFIQGHYDRTADRFGLFLAVQEMSSVSTVKYDFSVEAQYTDTEKKLIVLFADSYKYKSARVEAFGCQDLFRLPWSSVTAADSQFLIGGLLQLKIEVLVEEEEGPVDVSAA